MKDPNLTAPDLVESDFSAAGLQYAKNDKGQMLSLPWSVDYFILYYNKELFAEEGRRRSEDASTRWSRPPRSSPIPRKASTASSAAACATPT